MKNLYNIILPFLFSLLLVACGDDGDEIVNLKQEDPAITVTSISPVCGYIGEELTIMGKDFGISPELVKVFVGTSQFYILSCEDEEIRVKVPDGATTGRVSVEIMGEAVNTELVYTVLGQPSVTKVSPAYGFVGDEITIEGDNFGTIKDAVKLLFGNSEIAAQVILCENQKIVVKVPEDATSGSISLTISKQTVNVDPAGFEGFKVVERATLASISPASASRGCEVTLKGTNFGSSKENVKVFFGDATESAEILSCTNEEIVAKVPFGITIEETRVSVATQYERVETALDFTVLPDPVVTNIPTSTYAGRQITITGQYFVTSKEDIKVFFGNMKESAEIISCTNTEIVVKLPTDGLIGKVTISLQILGLSVNMGNYEEITILEAPVVKTVKSTNVLSQNNKSAKVPFMKGDNVILTGTGFGTDKDVVKVLFNDTEVTPVSVNATEVIATIPEGFSAGIVKLKYTSFDEPFVGAELQQVKAGDEVTEYILRNYKQPFESEKGITNGWDKPKYWEVNSASQNYKIPTYPSPSGFYINPNNQYSGGVLAMQAGWNDHNAMTDAKMWQTASLPAGDYNVELVIEESFLETSARRMYCIVNAGMNENAIPSATDEAINENTVKGFVKFENKKTVRNVQNFNVKLDQGGTVVFGFAASFDNNACGKISSIKITIQ